MGIPGLARVLLGMAWSTAALAAGERLYVQVPAELEPGAPIAAAVQRECSVETVLGNHVLREVQARYGGPVSARSEPGADRELRLTILGVLGVGPGPWGARKEISVRAAIVEGDREIASETFRSSVGGGGRMRGACELFDIIALRLARSIARWIPELSDVPAATATSTGSDAMERMRLLKELLDGGLITKDDYARKRAEVLKEL